jgi:putative membrane protein
MKNILTNKKESSDFFETAFKIEGSVTPYVIKTVLIFTAYSLLISLATLYYPKFSIPKGLLEFGGFVMGLILVFRINSGYDRWWEARKLWGSIVNQSRNLAIIIHNYQDSLDKTWSKKTLELVILFPFFIKDHLRKNFQLEKYKQILNQDTIDLLQKSDNPPNVISALIAKELNYAKKQNIIDHFSFLAAEQQRAQITDAQGACERILATPMPHVMAIKARRFIFIYLMALPFALVNYSIFISPLIYSLITYAFLSLDQISIELQNPFSIETLSHLPLDEICLNIEKNIREIEKMKSSK